MKTRTLFNQQLKPLIVCFVKSFLQYCSSGLSSYLEELAKATLAHPALVRGLAAAKAHLLNKRLVMGDLFLLLGIGAFFFHQSFQEAVTTNKNWYYQNWFYFFYTLRPCIMGVFWSLTSYYYTSGKTGKFIFSVMHSAAWAALLHYAFFVHDYKTFHTFPGWLVIVNAVSLAVGFILTMDHLVYLWEHKTKGILYRYVGLSERDNIPDEVKAPLYVQLAKEFRNLNSQY